MTLTSSTVVSTFPVAEVRIHTKPSPIMLYSSAYFKIYPRLTEPTAKQKVILLRVVDSSFLRVVEDELNMASERDLTDVSMDAGSRSRYFRTTGICTRGFPRLAAVRRSEARSNDQDLNACIDS